MIKNFLPPVSIIDFRTYNKSFRPWERVSKQVHLVYKVTCRVSIGATLKITPFTCLLKARLASGTANRNISANFLALLSFHKVVIHVMY